MRVVSFGCRSNAYESDVILARARAAGLGNAVVVNTCAVTAEAEKQARQAIRRLARANPGVALYVTGCAAELNHAAYAALPGVAGVVANAEKLRVESYAPSAVRGDADEERFFARDFAAKPRVYLQVQNGCGHRCTFCIIPHGRGASRSEPVGVIAARLKGLAAQGVNEVVLTGVDIASYGKDLPGAPPLGQMARRVLALVPGIPRIRFSSLDPAAIDDDFWRLFAEEPRVMPHLHLSAQAGDDMILKRMKRRHSRVDILALAARARALRGTVALGADLIAGFPTETDRMFENSLSLVEEAGLIWLHVFPFSPRPGAPAARMPGLDPGVIRRRAALLRRKGEEAARWFLDSRVGEIETVLVESNKHGKAHARTAHYAEIDFESAEPAGARTRVQVIRGDGKRLVGREIADEKTASGRVT